MSFYTPDFTFCVPAPISIICTIFKNDSIDSLLLYNSGMDLDKMNFTRVYVVKFCYSLNVWANIFSWLVFNVISNSTN